MRFKAIMQGNFNAISVNRRLRELYERVEKLEAEKAERVIHEGTPVEPSSRRDDGAGGATETASAQGGEDATGTAQFNWCTSTNIPALRAFAKSRGLTIKGTKKAAVIREEIAEFLNKEQ
jgi:hypothetical protein